MDIKILNLDVYLFIKKRVKTNNKNKSKQSNNTSGKNGISKNKKGKYSYWIASINYNNGNQIQKYFSIKKLGDASAKRQAIAWRVQKEQLYGYKGE